MNDLERWQALKRGNKQALEAIYREHAAALLKYGARFVPDQQLVEDCLQDLFIDLWRKKENLGDTDSIKRYLFVALRRKIIRQLERSHKRIASEEPQEYQFQAEISIDEQLIQKELGQEQAQKLQLAMKNLSKRQQEAVYLKFFAGLDYQAICEIMGVNYQSVRNLVSNALKAMRKYVQILFWAIWLNFYPFL